MSNVFEQPWLLLGVAVLVLLGVLTFRSVWSEKQRPWQWLLPLGVAGLAFGLDALVTTDREKIQTTAQAAIRAVQNEDCPAVAECIASNYHDSRHPNKAALMKACQSTLSGPTVTKIRKISNEADLTKIPEKPAIVTLVLAVGLEEKGGLAQEYGVQGTLLVGVQVYLSKQPDENWLISTVELRAVNNMPMGWSSVHEQ